MRCWGRQSGWCSAGERIIGASVSGGACGTYVGEEECM